MYKTAQEAQAAWVRDAARRAATGVIFDSAVGYSCEGWGTDYRLAMDAQPALASAPNAGILALLTTLVDPEIYDTIYAATEAANILGEAQKGTWTDRTIVFPWTEQTGDVSSYDDYTENGLSEINANFPERQNYVFQTMIRYGEMEVEVAALAKINLVTEKMASAAGNLNRFANLGYFYGQQGLRNYGILNDPNLSAVITPGTKAAGGVKWQNGSGVIVATANEIFTDIQSTVALLVAQTKGQVNKKSKMTLALSPTSEMALTATNSFNVSVTDLLSKNFPNLKVVSAVQYGAKASDNPNGIAAGNFMQIIADEVQGKKVGYCAFALKNRTHRLVVDSSYSKQKVSGAIWGAAIRRPVGIAGMLGI